MDSITVTPRWVEETAGRPLLMLGRLAVAWVVRAPDGTWIPGTQIGIDRAVLDHCCQDESTARALAEAHARRVLGDA